MACPYCGSGNWNLGEVKKMTHDEDWVLVDYKSTCEDCGKEFITRWVYKETDYYEGMTMEEYKDRD